jgi:Rod binding domain-containing protein
VSLPFAVDPSAGLGRDMMLRPAMQTSHVSSRGTWHGASQANVGTSTQTASSAKERKLWQAAGQFESMLLSNLWKSMKSAFEEDADESDPAHGVMDDWGIEAMCTGVGKSGGLGIAKLIMKDLEPKLRNAGRPIAGVPIGGAGG